ncbi:MAG: hypothetical protein VW378_05155 [bacterium]
MPQGPNFRANRTAAGDLHQKTPMTARRLASDNGSVQAGDAMGGGGMLPPPPPPQLEDGVSFEHVPPGNSYSNAFSGPTSTTGSFADPSSTTVRDRYRVGGGHVVEDVGIDDRLSREEAELVDLTTIIHTEVQNVVNIGNDATIGHSARALVTILQNLYRDPAVIFGEEVEISGQDMDDLMRILQKASQDPHANRLETLDAVSILSDKCLIGFHQCNEDSSIHRSKLDCRRYALMKISSLLFQMSMIASQEHSLDSSPDLYVSVKTALTNVQTLMFHHVVPFSDKWDNNTSLINQATGGADKTRAQFAAVAEYFHYDPLYPPTNPPTYNKLPQGFERFFCVDKRGIGYPETDLREVKADLDAHLPANKDNLDMNNESFQIPNSFPVDEFRVLERHLFPSKGVDGDFVPSILIDNSNGPDPNQAIMALPLALHPRDYVPPARELRDSSSRSRHGSTTRMATLGAPEGPGPGSTRRSSYDQSFDPQHQPGRHGGRRFRMFETDDMVPFRNQGGNSVGYYSEDRSTIPPVPGLLGNSTTVHDGATRAEHRSEPMVFGMPNRSSSVEYGATSSYVHTGATSDALAGRSKAPVNSVQIMGRRKAVGQPSAVSFERDDASVSTDSTVSEELEAEALESAGSYEPYHPSVSGGMERTYSTGSHGSDVTTSDDLDAADQDLSDLNSIIRAANAITPQDIMGGVLRSFEAEVRRDSAKRSYGSEIYQRLFNDFFHDTVGSTVQSLDAIAEDEAQLAALKEDFGIGSDDSVLSDLDMHKNLFDLIYSDKELLGMFEEYAVLLRPSAPATSKQATPQKIQQIQAEILTRVYDIALDFEIEVGEKYLQGLGLCHEELTRLNEETGRTMASLELVKAAQSSEGQTLASFINSKKEEKQAEVKDLEATLKDLEATLDDQNTLLENAESDLHTALDAMGRDWEEVEATESALLVQTPAMEEAVSKAKDSAADADLTAVAESAVTKVKLTYEAMNAAQANLNQARRRIFKLEVSYAEALSNYYKTQQTLSFVEKERDTYTQPPKLPDDPAELKPDLSRLKQEQYLKSREFDEILASIKFPVASFFIREILRRLGDEEGEEY